MELLMHIEGREILQALSILDEHRLNRHVGMLHRFRSAHLVMIANLLVSLFNRHHAAEFGAVQNYLAQNLFSDAVRSRLAQSQFTGRPVFSRQQLLMLTKKILRLCSDDGSINPDSGAEERHYLGRVSLNISNFLVPADLQARADNAENRSVLLRELVLQMTPTFELYNPSSFDNGIARSLEFLRLFNVTNPVFEDGKSLDEYVGERLGLGLQNLLEIFGSIYAYYLVHDEDLGYFLSNTANLNLRTTTFFQHVDIGREELARFFQLFAKSIDEFAIELENQVAPGREQFDFTVFRKFPILKLGEEIFSCFDIGFLLERVATSLFRTIHDCLPADPKDETRKEKRIAQSLSSKWGQAVETYASTILSNMDDFAADVSFLSGKGKQEQIDGVLLVEREAVIIETKGRYLSAVGKYSGDGILLTEIEQKFGRGEGGGIHQIVRDLRLLYATPPDESPITELQRRELLHAEIVYPVLVVDESSIRLDLTQHLLRSWFAEERSELSLQPNVNVRPLTILTMDVLEAMEDYLAEKRFTLLDFLRFACIEVELNDDAAMKDSHTLFFRFLQSQQIPWRANSRIMTIFGDFMDNFRWRPGAPVS